MVFIDDGDLVLLKWYILINIDLQIYKIAEGYSNSNQSITNSVLSSGSLKCLNSFVL